MKYFHLINGVLISCLSVLVTSCAQVGMPVSTGPALAWNPNADYSQRLPQTIDTKGEKVILVDPKVNAWGAYAPDGRIVRGGIATCGSPWCEDNKRPGYTTAGSFRIKSLGGPECKSSKYPKPTGGGLMPYCMFFNGAESLHGSPDEFLAEDNLSHGCVRMRIQDAEWVRYNFANIGTKVVVKPYRNT